MLVANNISKAIRSLEPNATVAFLAYLKTLPPPENIKPETGVFLEFAPVRRCYIHSINDSSCAINRKHWTYLLQLLDKSPPSTTHILEYWLDSSLFSQYKKPAIKPLYLENIVEQDLEAYSSLGITDITTFAVYMDDAYFKKWGDREFIHYSNTICA